MAIVSRYTSFGFGWHRYGTFQPKAPAVPMTGVEVLYPIQPSGKANVLSFRKDSMEWKGVQKSEQLWRHEYITLRYRIRDINMDAFYNFHVNNKDSIVNLAICGLQLFLRDATENPVRIIKIGSPKRNMPAHYEISITYLNTLITATT